MHAKHSSNTELYPSPLNHICVSKTSWSSGPYAAASPMSDFPGDSSARQSAPLTPSQFIS